MSNSHFDYKGRVKKVLNLLEKNDIDYALISNLQNLYWLTGTAQYGLLLISKQEDIQLFIRRNYFKAKEESYLTNIKELKSTSQVSDYLQESNASLEKVTIGMELDSLPASFYIYYKKLLKNAEFKNIELALRKLRMVKDQKELKLLREAAKTAQKAQETIPNLLKPGIRENDIAAEVIRTAIKNKSTHFSNVNSTFGRNWFIVASGKNLWIPSSFPILSGDGFSDAIPYGYTDRKLIKGDIVMCDYAVNYKGYHADHARTYYVQNPPVNFKERYLILKNSYMEVIEDYLKAGTSVSILFNKMKEILEEEDLGKYFEGDGYYYQGLGHGIGLELDEPPAVVSNNEIELKENMVIALEPKIIIPEWGAIDLEDDFIIKKNGFEKITHTDYLY
jgi:Xaa-Pro aminopeptidase